MKAKLSPSADTAQGSTPPNGGSADDESASSAPKVVVPAPDPSWPTRAEAAKKLGVSYPTVRNFEARGDIQPYDVNGIARFNPADLEALIARRAPADGGAAELIQAATALMRQTQQHEERFFELFILPIERHTNALLARVDSLEKKNSAMLEASEKALSLEHDRKLLQHEKEVSEARKNLVLSAGMKGISKITPGIMRHWGIELPPDPPAPAPPPVVTPPPAPPAPGGAGEPAATPEEDAAVAEDFEVVLKAIGKLDELHLAGLRATGTLTDAEVAALERLRAAARAAQAADAGDAAAKV